VIVGTAAARRRSPVHREHRLGAPGGPHLRLVDEGPVSAEAALLLHGFTGCAESMEGLAREIAGLRVVRVDLPGHGGSEDPRDPERWRPAALHRSLLAVLDALGLPAVHLVGYSLGGRMALDFAVHHPRRCRSVAVIGARAGFADPAERLARREADEALARRILEEGVPAFVDAWMALPLFRSQRRLGAAWLAAARAQRLRCRAEGLAGSLRGMGAGAQEPLHPHLPGLHVPVLVCVGEQDTRFHAPSRELVCLLPRAELAVIPRAGHAAHLENPAATGRRLQEFLARVATATGPHREERRTP